MLRESRRRGKRTIVRPHGFPPTGPWVPGVAGCCPRRPRAESSVSDPTLRDGRVVARFFGAAQNLPAEADALEPEMQAEKIGEAHAAMNLDCRARDMLANLGEMRLGVRRHQTRLRGKLVKGIGGVPDECA